MLILRGEGYILISNMGYICICYIQETADWHLHALRPEASADDGKRRARWTLQLRLLNLGRGVRGEGSVRERDFGGGAADFWEASSLYPTLEH